MPDEEKLRFEDALRAIAGGGVGDPQLHARQALEGSWKPGPRTKRHDWIPIDVIQSNLQVRTMLGSSGVPVPRSTLVRWRRDQDFPAPIIVLPGDIELWDRRAVRRWKRNRLRARGEKF